MVTAVEYALMSGRAYQTTRDLISQFPIPAGWLELQHVPNNPAYPQFTSASGFEATSFQSQSSNEIVISFAGTANHQLKGKGSASHYFRSHHATSPTH